MSGTAFGDFGEGYLRFSVANSIENIEKALDRVDAWTKKKLVGQPLRLLSRQAMRLPYNFAFSNNWIAKHARQKFFFSSFVYVLIADSGSVCGLATLAGASCFRPAAIRSMT